MPLQQVKTPARQAAAENVVQPWHTGGTQERRAGSDYMGSFRGWHGYTMVRFLRASRSAQ
jgi:hypothetical protein